MVVRNLEPPSLITVLYISIYECQVGLQGS